MSLNAWIIGSTYCSKSVPTAKTFQISWIQLWYNVWYGSLKCGNGKLRLICIRSVNTNKKLIITTMFGKKRQIPQRFSCACKITMSFNKRHCLFVVPTIIFKCFWYNHLFALFFVLWMSDNNIQYIRGNCFQHFFKAFQW